MRAFDLLRHNLHSFGLYSGGNDCGLLLLHYGIGELGEAPGETLSTIIYSFSDGTTMD